jgi:hypothetical protein
MAERIASGSLAANTVTQVVFNTWRSSLEIVNRSDEDMWARVDGTNPVVAANECIFVPAQSYVIVSNPKLPPGAVSGNSSNCDIRMISAAVCDYTVSAGL